MKEIKRLFETAEEMYTDAACYVAETIQQHTVNSVNALFSLVLAGGSTPASVYKLLASRYIHLPWQQVHFFWGDERYVPPHDKDSNYNMAYETLLAHLKLSPAQIHRIRTELSDPARTAAAYEEELQNYFSRFNLHQQTETGKFPDWSQLKFNLTLLGMGPDGHIASLFPHTPALGINDKLVIPIDIAPLPPQVPRITMSFPLINNSERVIFLISGKQKVNLLKQLEKDSSRIRDEYPVTRVQARKELVWFINES